MDEKKLIETALEGDEESLRILIKHYLKPVYGFVFRLVGNQADTEDLIQEIFLKFWKNLSKFKKEESLKTWIFTIARNSAFDFFRKKKNLVFSDLVSKDNENPLESLEDQSSLPDELLIQNQNKAALEAILSRIPLIYREVILLRYFQDFSLEEISQILKRPANTVKSQHLRALKILKRLLNAPENHL